MNTDIVKLDSEQIAKIEAALAKGDRVELIPVKDGIKLLRVRRTALK